MVGWHYQLNGHEFEHPAGCMPCPAHPTAPELTMKTVGIVQPLALATGDVDGHRELPLDHGGLELGMEGRVRPNATQDSQDPRPPPPGSSSPHGCPLTPAWCRAHLPAVACPEQTSWVSVG